MSAAHLSTITLRTCRVGQFVSYTFPEQGSNSPKAHPLFSYLLIPEGSAKHSWISREDCARAATGALIGKLTTTGPVDVTGPEALSFADLASHLSSLSDHQITAHPLPDQEIIAQVIAKGVPADAARSTMRLISWIAHESTETPTDTVERASGTKPISIDTTLRTLVTA